MRHEGRYGSGAAVVGLLSAVILLSAPAILPAAQADEPHSEVSPPLAAGTGPGPEPEDYVTLEVRETELVLTNASDRTIVAWTVRQVTRITKGNLGYGSITVDAADHSLIPGGYEKLLLPGESLTLERPGDPWIRPDLKGPDYLVYYDVGALVFENAEAVGDPKFVDRIFDHRLRFAREALTALEVIGSGAPKADALPERYRRRLSQFASRSDGFRAILGEARASYENAVASLRPEDLAKLPELEEKLR